MDAPHPHTEINALDSNGFRPAALGARRLETAPRECLALARNRKWDSCAALARRWLDTDPTSTDAALYLLNALKAPATADAYQAALEEYALLERRLDRQYQRSPAREVAELAASIQDNLATTRKPSVTGDSPLASPAKQRRDAAPGEANVPNLRVADRSPFEMAFGRVSTSRFASIPLAAALFLGATSFTGRHAALRPATGLGNDRPSVAVIDVRNTAGDSATAWLELGLPQMVSSNIARMSGIDVVSPERVRESRQALGLPRGASLTRDEIRRLGEESGAGWVVTGSIVRGDKLYVLDLTMERTSGDVERRPVTVTSPSLIALADQAAATLASVATAERSILARRD